MKTLVTTESRQAKIEKGDIGIVMPDQAPLKRLPKGIYRNPGKKVPASR